MDGYSHGTVSDWKVRVHPYIAIHEGQSGWLDLRREPERIETDLEDFREWSSQPSIRRFYELLRWINSEESPLESCDCAFRSPHPHAEEDRPRLSADGRLMILYRDLQENCSLERVKWLCETLVDELHATDMDLSERVATIDIWAVQALQRDISHCQIDDEGMYHWQYDDPGLGHHLLIQFCAFADDGDAAFDLLDRVFANLTTALKNVADLISQS